MNSILEQQLELEFGDNYPDIKANTTSYVKGLISKPWWVDRRALVTSEGPLTSMVTDCLCHVLEQKDLIKGWKAYTSYLTKFYGTAYATSSGVPEGDKPVEWSSLGEWANSRPLPEELTLSEANVGEIPEWVSQEQAEFMEAFSRMSLGEVAEIYGLSNRATSMRKQTIKKTLRRRVS